MQSSFPWIVLAIITVSYVIPFVATLFRLLRFTVFEIKISRLAEFPALSELQQAAVDELIALGFKPSIAFVTHDGADTFPGLMLRHETLPAFADIKFRVSALAAYPVIFYSFEEDGALLLTVNREPTSLEYPGARQRDAFAENLDLHWKSHAYSMKNTKLVNLDDEAAYSQITKLNEEYFPYHIQKKIIVNHSGDWFLSLPTALKMTTHIMACRKKLRKLYQTVLTSDKYQSTYYAERYETEEKLKKRSKYRFDLATHSLILSLIVSATALTLFWGWQPAVAIIAVLLVHEFGHALAMFIFGYRDMNMFFVPFLGAFVSGNAKNISVWKQSLILLAGPVPGLIFGWWAIHYAYTYSGPHFLFRLGYTALGINLFNLLPISFLDGGRLLEIGFFTRWPYAGLVFSFLSCLGMGALIVMSKNYNLLIIALLMALSLKTAWQIAYVRHTWKEDPDRTDKLEKLFAFVREKFGNLTFQRQSRIVKSIYDPPHVNPPRVWETALTLSLFLFIWLPVGMDIWHKWGGVTHGN